MGGARVRSTLLRHSRPRHSQLLPSALPPPGLLTGKAPCAVTSQLPPGCGVVQKPLLRPPPSRTLLNRSIPEFLILESSISLHHTPHCEAAAMQGGGGKRRVVAGAPPELAELPVKLADPELIKPASAGDGENAPLFLSNIDQVLAFSVETVYFYRANPDKPSLGVASTLREALKKVLVHYQFLAGRLRLNAAERRLEVDCNGTGAQFGEADTELRLADLGDVTLPNPAFRTLVPQAWGAAKITDVPLLMVQVTRFRCGGFSVGFTMGHINYDGVGAIDFLTNFTSFCKGGDMVVFPVHDRTLLRARDPPQVRFDHPEYISPEDIALLAASNPFTTADVANGKLQDLHASQRHIYRVFHFPAEALDHLKTKAAGQEQEEEPEPAKEETVKPNNGNGYHINDPNGHSNGNSHGHNNGNSNGHTNGNSNGHINGNSNDNSNGNDSNGNDSNGNGSVENNGNGFHSKGSIDKVSTFEALASHIWQARSRAVDCPAPTAPATMLFAVDIRGRMSPPLPRALCCNAVFSACARATFQELKENPLTFCVEKVQSAIGRVTDDYVRSSLDWWEVHRGIPALPGGVFISAWWKLPFYQVDFGWGKPVFAGPIVSSMTEFVLLLPTARPEGGLNVVISLLPHEMDKFEKFVQI